MTPELMRRNLLLEYKHCVDIAARMATSPAECVGDEQDRPTFRAHWEGKAEGIARALVCVGFEKNLRYVRGDVDSAIARIESTRTAA